jgi:sec-independent protein translocase protein TatA
MHLGVPELLLILVIVIILFGAGRIARLGGELGQAVGNFRKGLDSSSPEDKAKVEEAPKI